VISANSVKTTVVAGVLYGGVLRRMLPLSWRRQKFRLPLAELLVVGAFPGAATGVVPWRFCCGPRRLSPIDRASALDRASVELACVALASELQSGRSVVLASELQSGRQLASDRHRP